MERADRLLHPAVERAAEWAGVALTDQQRDLLRRFAGWLATEARQAGGIGPDDDVMVRHIADSLTFAAAWRDRLHPQTILDLGSGVGLPGLVLAVLHPVTHVTLLDRSGRRVRLARRATRILNLENVEIIRESIERAERPAEIVVSRASLPPQRLLSPLMRLVERGGIGAVGGSHSRVVKVPGYQTLEIPSDILDREASLLIMAPP